MANVNSFSLQSPYDQQMEELKRRQRMAEMLQQQAMQPLESQMAGGMVVPISPVQGLAKMLQTYMTNKQLSNLEKKQADLGRLDQASTRNFIQDVVEGKQQPMSADQALQASLSSAPTEATRVPMDRSAMLATLLGGATTGTPGVRNVAGALLPSAMAQPTKQMKFADINPSDFTPESLKAASAADNPALLVRTAKQVDVRPVTVMKNGKSVIIDANTGNEIGQAPVAEMTPYQKEMLALRGRELTAKQAGKQLLSPTAQKELFETDENIASTGTGISMLQDALKLSDKAFEGAAAYQRAYAASNMPESMQPAGTSETLEFDNLLKQQILPQLKSIFGAAPTEGERKILLEITGSASLPKATRNKIINRAMAAAQTRLNFNQDKAKRLRTGEYFQQPTVQLPPGFEMEGQ